jgi:hypothetical protein
VPRVVSDIHRCGPDRIADAKRSNPVSRVSVALSRRLCAGGTDRLEELQKHAPTGENRVNGNEITLC